MVDSKATIRTLLLVDDDNYQLELRAVVLKMSGFTVLTAASPLEAILISAKHCKQALDLAVLDYEMPVMNGCVLAGYLRSRHPELKIILHSGAIDIPEDQISSVNSLVGKGEGVARLLQQISLLLGCKAEVTHSSISSEPCQCAAPAPFNSSSLSNALSFSTFRNRHAGFEGTDGISD